MKIEESIDQLNQKISIGIAEVKRSAKAAHRINTWQVFQTVMTATILVIVIIGVLK
jgi:hypothetical protein